MKKLCALGARCAHCTSLQTCALAQQRPNLSFLAALFCLVAPLGARHSVLTGTSMLIPDSCLLQRVATEFSDEVFQGPCAGREECGRE